MKKFLFSVGSPQAFQGIGLLLFRLMFGFGMAMGHGWGKLITFGDKMDSFPDPFGVSSPVSLTMAVFAEVLCAALVGIGLFTRAALIPLIITMAVAAFMIHGGDPFAQKEMACLYLTGYLGLFLMGPGKYSFDQLFR
ncbi:DoxX family protein [Kiritimatiellaeota bacterium B1221]|nr:DoxX family protein [Kiritimatiellaeota bacterium B1221]